MYLLSAIYPHKHLKLINTLYHYVDGLAIWAPEDPALYKYRAQKAAEHGYTHVDHYMPTTDSPT
ncbi:hypothetical protein GCM10027185_35040 [Spirosoma pulveris]